MVMARSDKYILQLVARKAVIAAGFDAALRPFADQLALPSKLRLAKTVWSNQGEI